MESALDMLSRAATMVQTGEAQREAALKQTMMSRESPPLKRGLDGRDSPPKELSSSKMLRLQGYPEKMDVPSHVYSIERHLDRCNNRKCAGTQTPFSSLNSEVFSGPSVSSSLMSFSTTAPVAIATSSSSSSSSEHHHIHNQPFFLDLDKTTAAVRAASSRSSPSSLSSSSSSSSSTSNLRDLRIKSEMEEQLSPLNLSNGASASSSKCCSSPSRSYHRPSVITCATTTSATPGGHNQRETNNDECLNNRIRNLPSSRLREQLPPLSPQQKDLTAGVNMSMCDPAIEEHFRRSLGKHYPASVSPASSPSPVSFSEESNSPPHADNAVSVTGSVDDHFAKSLGDKWSQIKAKNERDLFSGTVDDHFTKALGDTWLRLKAKQDSPPVGRDLAPAPSHITCGPHPLLHS